MHQNRVVSGAMGVLAAAALLGESPSAHAGTIPPIRIPIRPIIIPVRPAPVRPSAPISHPSPASHPAAAPTSAPHTSPASAPHESAPSAHPASAETHPAGGIANPAKAGTLPNAPKLHAEDPSAERSSLPSSKLTPNFLYHLNGVHPQLLPLQTHGLGTDMYVYSVQKTNDLPLKIISPAPLDTNTTVLKGDLKQVGSGTNSEYLLVLPKEWPKGKNPLTAAPPKGN